MSFLRPIQWYNSQADPILADGTFKFFLFPSVIQIWNKYYFSLSFWSQLGVNIQPASCHGITSWKWKKKLSKFLISDQELIIHGKNINSITWSQFISTEVRASMLNWRNTIDRKRFESVPTTKNLPYYLPLATPPHPFRPTMSMLKTWKDNIGLLVPWEGTRHPLLCQGQENLPEKKKHLDAFLLSFLPMTPCQS